MKVYHGTSFKFLDTILKEGITPRQQKRTRKKRRSNWTDAPSHENMVYASTAYPWYYAVNANYDLSKGVVFEIDLDALNESNVYPDEDFVFQAMKNEIKEVTHSYIRSNLEFYKYQWKNSLEYMGNICHKGTIPISAITRYCIIDFDLRIYLCTEMLQPVMSIDNYQFVGKRYEAMNSWCFGDIEELPFVEYNKKLIEMCKKEDDRENDSFQEQSEKNLILWTEESKNREGIEVVIIK